jgi:hypothetical protein
VGEALEKVEVPVSPRGNAEVVLSSIFSNYWQNRV